MTTSTSSSRTAALGLVAGAILLAVVAAFAIFLPKAHGSEIELPETLPGGLERVVQPEDSEFDESEIEGSAADALAELYDADATVGDYATADRSAQVTVTVLDVPAGPFLPTGPVPDPETYGYARGATELVTVGDAICSLNYAQPVPSGQPVDEDEQPAGAFCQLGSGERTFLASGSGVAPDAIVDILESLAD
ncbi:MAG: hypothetical protein F2667_02315 [Actinobacteria bacterium]|uniref:Unannotated protein n=1 Tax=freshwater metagenome TaxID=449393 RepID=A0A6J6P4B6_9ZZZZ|nr:hypothetical protein [Actinomycetota bacterium]